MGVFAKIYNLFLVIFIWLWTIKSAILGFVLLLFLGQKRSIYYASKFWSWPIIWLSGVKVEIEGLENVSLDKNVIYAANHESSFDIPVMFASMPVPLFYLAKEELKKIPIFGWYVNAVGMVFINRTNHSEAMASLKRAGEEIKSGKNIISFPEGTRPRDGKMKLFKRGSFVLALESNIDIVPVAIVGSRQVNPPGYVIKSGTIKVKIGKPINPINYDKANPDQLALDVENEVRRMYERVS